MVRVIINSGQRNFIDGVILRASSPSLRGLLQFGLSTTYTNLKNYYTERRLLPKEIFVELCYLANINPVDIDIEEKNDNWGQVRGGKFGKK